MVLEIRGPSSGIVGQIKETWDRVFMHECLGRQARVDLELGAKR